MTYAEPVRVGNPAAPAAVIAHGAGSTAEFVTRTFAPALTAAGLHLVTWDRHGAHLDEAAAQLADLVSTCGAQVIGGISAGAVLAVRHLVDCPSAATGLLLALPAWVGPPGQVAKLSADAAETIERDGLRATLQRITTDAVPWVAAELAAAWPTYDEQVLVAELRDIATSNGPSNEDLTRCPVPAGVVALDGDLFHPAAVAHAWAQALPNAVVETVPLTAPADDVAVIGAAAVRAWQRAANASR